MEQKNILVTGGGRGIGAGVVRALVSAGQNVAFCGRAPQEKYAEFLTELKALPNAAKVCYFQCDISSREDRAALLDSFEREVGELDCLCNNAGVAPEVRNDVLDMTEESFDRVLDINLKGPFFLTQAAARRMMANANGKFHCIINTGSISAETASISRGEYCISKAGVAMATKLWAVRLAEAEICVYEIRPGVIHSDMTRCVEGKYDKLIAEGLTLQPRWGEPADVGRAVLALCNGAFAYSTGQVIQVDGGMSISRL